MALGATTASADSYTIKPGDTLKSIASSNGTSVEQLAKDNNISNINLIFAGETIQVNGTYTVQQNVQQVTTEAPVQVSVKPTQEYTVATPVQVSVKPTQEYTVAKTSQTSNSGSVHDQFIAAGGTEALWTTVVLPESGGNPDAVSPNGYTGLGQTKESWGHGSVAEQTKGLVNYANSRYGSIDNAVSFRSSNNWW